MRHRRKKLVIRDGRSSCLGRFGLREPRRGHAVSARC